MSLTVERVTTFSLTREKNSKQVEMKPYSTTGKLIQPGFKVLRDFISRNLAIILSTYEESPRTGTKVKPLYIESPLKRSKKRAYILGFWKNDRIQILRSIMKANDATFLDLSEKIANWLKESLFWPKTYLFVAQFNLEAVKDSKGFVGILLTKLAHGQLAEDEQRVLQQIKTGVIGSEVKKGHLFPHVVTENGLTVEEKVKSFEDQPVPAQYFYDFLHLEHPVYAQRLAEESYLTFRKAKTPKTIQQFRALLEKKNGDVSGLARATIEIDGVEVKAPLSKMDSTVLLGKNDLGYLVLVKGKEARAKLGKHDLVADGVVQAKSFKQIAKEAEGPT